MGMTEGKYVQLLNALPLLSTYPLDFFDARVVYWGAWFPVCRGE